ncbi:hypothetical protein FISHEDRAFT_75282 [Fistulina hepatica ATCC 64428]|uniref:AB hydrolase-1 domain-containing protein n=1 Tax=Fistulina hepatica ATCC 64428 TaxID=1128425 RepID=A0A0D7A8Z4_9AGAR|nr:hypothetical protein FISHEDRAFT_75282 [Fistulina hepatica ATCC 64428]
MAQCSMDVLFPYCAGHNIRLVVVNRKVYPGSSKYTDDEIEDLHRFISAHDIPRTGLHQKLGGITVVGWSMGAAMILPLLAYPELVPTGILAKLSPYIKDYILYDPPYLVLRYSLLADHNAYNSLWTNLDCESPEERYTNFKLWISSYFKHPDIVRTIHEPDSCKQAGRPSVLNIPAQFQKFVNVLAAMPRCLTTVLHGNTLLVCAKHQGSSRDHADACPMRFVKVNGENHFLHWNNLEKWRDDHMMTCTAARPRTRPLSPVLLMVAITVKNTSYSEFVPSQASKGSAACWIANASALPVVLITISEYSKVVQDKRLKPNSVLERSTTATGVAKERTVVWSNDMLVAPAAVYRVLMSHYHLSQNTSPLPEVTYNANVGYCDQVDRTCNVHQPTTPALIRAIGNSGFILLKNTGGPPVSLEPDFHVAVLGTDATDNSVGPDGCGAQRLCMCPYVVTPVDAIKDNFEIAPILRDTDVEATGFGPVRTPSDQVRQIGCRAEPWT